MTKIKTYLKKKNTWYHSTFDNYDTFDFSKSSFGMHFGTKESAESRVDVKILEDERNGGYVLKNKKDNPIMLCVELSYNNALILDENRVGQWTPFDIRREAIERHEKNPIEGFTDKDIKEYYDDETSLNGVLLVDLIDESYGGEEYNLEYKEHLFIRDWLKSKGYDAVKYKNEFEGGGESIIVFENSQIEILNKYGIKEVPSVKPKILKKPIM